MSDTNLKRTSIEKFFNYEIMEFSSIPLVIGVVLFSLGLVLAVDLSLAVHHVNGYNNYWSTFGLQIVEQAYGSCVDFLKSRYWIEESSFGISL